MKKKSFYSPKPTLVFFDTHETSLTIWIRQARTLDTMLVKSKDMTGRS